MCPCRIYLCILCIFLPCLSWAQNNTPDDILDSLRSASGYLDPGLSELVSRKIPSDPVFLYNVKMYIASRTPVGNSETIESIPYGTFDFSSIMNWEIGLSFEYISKRNINSQLYKYCLDIGWETSEYACVEGNRRGLFNKDFISLAPSVKFPIDLGHFVSSFKLGFRNMYLLRLRKKEMSLPLYYINMDVFRRYRLDVMLGFSFHISIFEFGIDFMYPVYNGSLDADRLAYYLRSPVTVGTEYNPEIRFSCIVSLFGNSRN